jgi:hypothetical protein
VGGQQSRSSHCSPEKLEMCHSSLQKKTALQLLRVCFSSLTSGLFTCSVFCWTVHEHWGSSYVYVYGANSQLQ